MAVRAEKNIRKGEDRTRRQNEDTAPYAIKNAEWAISEKLLASV